jgi:anti-sigma regulatory factor (Ser/Thr protein kinase)
MHTVRIGNVASHDTDPFGKQRDAPPASPASFAHEALFHRGEEEFLAGVLPFIAEALEREEPVMVAVSGERCALLAGALGGDAAAVAFADMRELGANPARLIPAWQRFLDGHPPSARAVRGIGEPLWSGRSAAELDECDRHEQVVNAVFGRGRPWRMLCSYDRAALSEAALRAAELSHPLTRSQGRSIANAAFRPAADPFAGELPAPAVEPRTLRFAAGGLADVRDAVKAWASTALPPARAADLVLAVNELASNSLLHGGGSGELSMWMEGSTLMCEISDGGCITAPLAGRAEPHPGQLSGRGLWMANQICDLVRIRSAPGAGTTVRVQLHAG